MQTQAHFENIQPQILKELMSAEKSIFVAIAWFTDSELFRLLINKVKQGVSVDLLILNDGINNHSEYGLDFNELRRIGGVVNLIGSTEEIMHNKFCVIDSSTIITGSYNWTKRARNNDENITITKNCDSLALDFVAEFKRLKRKYLGDQTAAEGDLNILMKRLEILKNTISLEDSDEIDYQLVKLKKVFSASLDNELEVALQQIVQNINSHRFGDAVALISTILAKFQSLVFWVDPEIAGLQLEIRALSIQLSSLEDEQAEIERTLHAFEVRHTEELGTIILRLLALRKIAAERKIQENPTSESARRQYEATEQEESNYKNDYNENSKNIVFKLSVSQEQELREKFRKISKLSHPDLVDMAFTEEASELFMKAKEAKDRNDLNAIQQILEYLERGKPMKLKFETISEMQELRGEASRLRYLIGQIVERITKIKHSETYRMIEAIDSWESYFNQTKQKLQTEMATLEQYLIVDGR